MPPEQSTLPAPAMAAGSVPADWRAPLVALVVVSFALMLATVSSWGEMFHQWWAIDTYNHLLLVPFIMGWLVWLKAGELTRIAPKPFWPGLVLVVAALCLWLAGRASGINLLAHAGAVVALQAAVLSVLGLRAALLLALPLAMGAFLVPFGDEIIPPLQFVTAEIAVTLVRWSGVPAQIEGLHIDTPAGLFIVAEACSGVKFLVAMATLGVLVAFTRFASWRRRALFMAACVIVPILANGVRAFATIYVAQSIGAEAATGFDHIIYGWVFFAIVLALVLAGAWRWFEREPEQHGWDAASLAKWDWLSRAETHALAPASAVLATCSLAAIAALAAML
ncbi:exosortase A [Porphyrobacter sp. LM 6]|uniref:exosortase A n=1 Tax=Porphyrobacter sp. LM 6 TaxID=1896196 RepID=UPI000846A621|nr:exosortase A [Porphyrobacter sp. LM 6]AOL94971.1 exosortase A [Porphyrobacter sp. LM 6]